MSKDDIVEAAAQEIVGRVKELLEQEVAGIAALRWPARDGFDGRSKTWGCTIVFRSRRTLQDDWDIRGHTEGAVFGEDGEPSTFACERIAALPAIADKIAEYAEVIGAPVDFCRSKMLGPLQNLRPTLTRRNGVAVLRRGSADGLWHLSCYVFREDRIPE